MRGIATVILVGFIAAVMLGLVAPAIIEPIGEVVANDPAVQSNPIDGEGIVEGMKTSLFVWGTLFFLAAGVVSAVVWYFRKERVSARVPR